MGILRTLLFGCLLASPNIAGAKPIALSAMVDACTQNVMEGQIISRLQVAGWRRLQESDHEAYFSLMADWVLRWDEKYLSDALLGMEPTHGRALVYVRAHEKDFLGFRSTILTPSDGATAFVSVYRDRARGKKLGSIRCFLIANASAYESSELTELMRDKPIWLSRLGTEQVAASLDRSNGRKRFDLRAQVATDEDLLAFGEGAPRANLILETKQYQDGASP
jgi:hypothetical protein